MESVAVAVAVSVSAVTALRELIISRDDELNEKAYQRAMVKKTSENNHWLDSYISTTFQLSKNVSMGQMIEERLSRERIIRMQTEINRDL